MATTTKKSREIRLRRMAERQGLRVVKSRRRDPLAKDFGRYWVVDPGQSVEDTHGAFREGEHPAHRFPWSGGDLDDVEAYLTTPWEERDQR
jgi:hypothetical protein